MPSVPTPHAPGPALARPYVIAAFRGRLYCDLDERRGVRSLESSSGDFLNPRASVPKSLALLCA